MKLGARLSLFGWAALLVVGCSSTTVMKAEPDGSAEPTGTHDAARDPGMPRGMVGGAGDGPREKQPDAGPDARSDSGSDAADAAAPDGNRVSAHDCSAGHTCRGNTTCQRACFGQLLYRCSCADGRFVCTGCIAVDGGPPDLRGGPPTCAAEVTDGRRCDPAGAVCQQRGDASQRFCACGDLMGNHVWICQ
jgi:hypothetical protein